MKINTEDNFSLDAIYKKAEDSNKGVILAHGMTVSKDDEGIFVRAEQKLNDAGFTTIRFDFRAHGDSQGKPINDFTISGELKDLDAVFGFFEKEGIEQIGLAGASFGGSISALYSGKFTNKVNALFLANPVLNYKKCFLSPTTSWGKENFGDVFNEIEKQGFIKVGSREFKMGKDLFKEMEAYHPCKKMRNYQNPLLIVHGDEDEKVSYQDVTDCYNELPNEKKKLKIMEGSKHGFHEEPYETEVVDLIVDFFKEFLE